MISGVALETNCSDCMPRFALYHWVVRGIEATVRTKWSRDLMCAAGKEDIFPYMLEFDGTMRIDIVQ